MSKEGINEVRIMVAAHCINLVVWLLPMPQKARFHQAVLPYIMNDYARLYNTLRKEEKG